LRRISKLKAKGHSVWYDVNLEGGKRFRDVIRLRIDAAKAVVAVWSKHSIGSDWVVWEATRANEQRKLICVSDPALDVGQIPPPFPPNFHTIELDNELLNARFPSVPQGSPRNAPPQTALPTPDTRFRFARAPHDRVRAKPFRLSQHYPNAPQSLKTSPILWAHVNADIVPHGLSMSVFLRSGKHLLATEH
jgi:hypothetical protein